ncbi:helix-turn-helix transcriptional regulator [Helicobacter sp. 11S03491-1]|uniref:helix-turn-helix domain-containing protein n=1 Tax=Helicobacter sp. 11S03491-1 TaxID=1476196 RepID=UPI000BA60790|nr:helix-turn-helix transcriptional regulator [Helicobacter sp. 11S03491-1]PAF41799.1 hypothetical protein BKH45_05660 [Helicobacter sp. 11S03491-1]
MKNKINLQTYNINDLKAKYLKGEVLKEYQALEPLIEIKSKMLQARNDAKLTQEDVAKALNTYVSNISRLESSSSSPSLNTLMKYAQACGKKLKIDFVDR